MLLIMVIPHIASIFLHFSFEKEALLSKKGRIWSLEGSKRSMVSLIAWRDCRNHTYRMLDPIAYQHFIIASRLINHIKILSLAPRNVVLKSSMVKDLVLKTYICRYLETLG